MPDLEYDFRVWETSTDTGTGTFDLDGANGSPTGLVGFVAAGLAGKKVTYMIAHRTLAEWERGVGTITDGTPDTLSRDKVYRSSNSDGLVDFSAGTKDVFVFDDPGFVGGVHTITGETTLGIQHDVVLCNSGSDFTVTLPPVADWIGKTFTIKNVSNGTVTVSKDAGDGAVVEDRVLGLSDSWKLFVQGDYARWVSDGSAWRMIEDGLRPHQALMHRITSAQTGETAGTWTQILFNSTVYNIGGIADIVTNNRFDFKRDGVYEFGLQAAPNTGVSDQKYYQLRLYDGTNQLGWYPMRQSVSGSSVVFGTNLYKVLACAAGSFMRADFKSEEGARGVAITFPGDDRDGATFFSCTEKR